MSHSITISLNNNHSKLTANFLPPLELKNGSYECALIYFKSYNSIPNVSSHNNLFHIGEHTIKIPEGSYEVSHIFDIIRKEVMELTNSDIYLNANINTLKCEIFSNNYDIYFQKKNSIGSLLGYSKKVLRKGEKHVSDRAVDILVSNTIRVECNLIEGSYLHDKPSYILHEFSPTVPPGYQIIEVPKTPLYLPIRNNIIQHVEVSLIDEQDRLVNFRGEQISIRIHIRKCS